MSPFLGCWDCIAKLDRRKNNGGKWSKNRESGSFVGWYLDLFGGPYRLYDEGGSGHDIQGKCDFIAGGKILRLWDIPGGFLVTCMIMNGTTIEYEDGSTRTVGEYMHAELLSMQKDSEGRADNPECYIFVKE